MIQRIQTLWMLLAAIVISLSFFFPFAKWSSSELGSTIVEIKNLTALDFVIVIIFIANVIVGLLYAIFQYKNRKVQLLFCYVCAFFSLLCAGMMFYLGFKEAEGKTLYFGIVFPVISFLFILMAILAIRKDEKLIKSLDRLR